MVVVSPVEIASALRDFVRDSYTKVYTTVSLVSIVGLPRTLTILSLSLRCSSVALAKSGRTSPLLHFLTDGVCLKISERISSFSLAANSAI